MSKTHMTDSDIIACVDFCADYITQYRAWPAEFVITTTEPERVLQRTEFLPHIKREAPSLYRMLNDARLIA